MTDALNIPTPGAPGSSMNLGGAAASANDLRDRFSGATANAEDLLLRSYTGTRKQLYVRAAMRKSASFFPRNNIGRTIRSGVKASNVEYSLQHGPGQPSPSSRSAGRD